MEDYKPSRFSKSRTAGMIAEATSENEIDGGKQEPSGVVMSSYKVRTDELDASPQVHTAGTVAGVAAEAERDSRKRGRKPKPGGVVLSNYKVKTDDADSSLLQSRTPGTTAEAAAKSETDGKKQEAKSKTGGVVLSSYRMRTDDSETVPQSGKTTQAVTESEAVGKKQEAKSKTGGVVLSSYRVRTDDSDTGFSRDLTSQATAGAATVSMETAALPVGPTALHKQSKQAPSKPSPYRVPKRQSKSEPVLTASSKKTDSSALGSGEQTAASATSSSASVTGGGRGRGVSRGDTLTRLRGGLCDFHKTTVEPLPVDQLKISFPVERNFSVDQLGIFVPRGTEFPGGSAEKFRSPGNGISRWIS